MPNIYLYHLSPSRNRLSIETEGLRRTRLALKRLVSYAAPRLRIELLALHIAELHDTTPEYLDLWRVKVDRDMAYLWQRGMYRILVDVPPENCTLISSGKIEE